MSSVPEWTQASQQFQKSLSDNWQHALQAFGGLAGGGAGMGSLPDLPHLPQLTFAPEKLQALQQAYVKEASSLWNTSLTAHSAAADKRFASDAWCTLSSAKTGTGTRSMAPMRSARRRASGTPRVRTPTSSKSRAPPLRSRISCAMRVNTRRICSLSRMTILSPLMPRLPSRRIVA